MDLFDIAVASKLAGGGGGDEPVLIDKTITANGTYNASSDNADGYKKVVANVPSVTPTGNINITSTAQTDVSAYATAQVVDADLVASNIKKDVDILGVVGTYEGGGGGGVNVGDAAFTRESSTKLSTRLNGEPKAFAIYFIGNFTQSSSSTNIYFGTMVVANNSTKVIKVYNRANGKYGELSSVEPSANITWAYANNIITITTDSLYFPSDSFGFYKITYIY